MSVIQIIKSSLFCKELDEELGFREEQLTLIDDLTDNCGTLSPSTEEDDIKKANKKILLYINSLKGKQRCVTPSQISKELGYSQNFIESILISNGFEED